MHASDVVLAGLGAVVAVAGVTAAACAVGASRLKPSAPEGAPVDAGGYRADDAAVERFRELIRIPTVSREDASLRHGLNTYKGKLTFPAVGEALGMPAITAEEALA